MPALSHSSLLKKLTLGELVISPILMPKKQIGGSSIDLRMGTVALIARAGAQSHVDPLAYRRNRNGASDHSTIQMTKQKHERFDIPFNDSFLLHPGALVLVPTLEWVVLPYNLQGVVTARSSWAREGLNIATATIINPGYKGIITLELANFGEIPICLYPGLRLAQIAFYELSCDKPELDKDMIDSQFDMSFEPSAGDIGLGDDPFLPLEINPEHGISDN
jgi:dCTP deaminase